MISAVMAAEIEGEGGENRPLDERELLDFIFLLSGAGVETVSRLMGLNCMNAKFTRIFDS